jgi:hypothetical protein
MYHILIKLELEYDTYSNKIRIRIWYMCVCVCMCVCVRAHARVCKHMYVWMYVYVCACVSSRRMMFISTKDVKESARARERASEREITWRMMLISTMAVGSPWTANHSVSVCVVCACACFCVCVYIFIHCVWAYACLRVWCIHAYIRSIVWVHRRFLKMPSTLTFTI